MAELNFVTYTEAIRPALMKHTEQEDAAVFLLNSVSGHKDGEDGKDVKNSKLPGGSTLNRIVRGVLPVPENIRLASAKPEILESTALYFREEVVQDINPHLKDEVTERLLNLIRGDVTIPESRKESLLALEEGDDYARFLSETFVYAINRPFNINPEDGQQKISIPLLVFTFVYGISIYGLTMFTIIKTGVFSQTLMAFAFFFSIGLFIFLIGFYFFLWRRDI